MLCAPKRLGLRRAGRAAPRPRPAVPAPRGGRGVRGSRRSARQRLRRRGARSSAGCAADRQPQVAAEPRGRALDNGAGEVERPGRAHAEHGIRRRRRHRRRRPVPPLGKRVDERAQVIFVAAVGFEAQPRRQGAVPGSPSRLERLDAGARHRSSRPEAEQDPDPLRRGSCASSGKLLAIAASTMTCADRPCPRSRSLARRSRSPAAERRLRKAPLELRQAPLRRRRRSLRSLCAPRAATPTIPAAKPRRSAPSRAASEIAGDARSRRARMAKFARSRSGARRGRGRARAESSSAGDRLVDPIEPEQRARAADRGSAPPRLAEARRRNPAKSPARCAHCSRASATSASSGGVRRSSGKRRAPSSSAASASSRRPTAFSALARPTNQLSSGSGKRACASRQTSSASSAAPQARQQIGEEDAGQRRSRGKRVAALAHRRRRFLAAAEPLQAARLGDPPMRAGAGGETRHEIVDVGERRRRIRRAARCRCELVTRAQTPKSLLSGTARPARRRPSTRPASIRCVTAARIWSGSLRCEPSRDRRPETAPQRPQLLAGGGDVLGAGRLQGHRPIPARSPKRPAKGGVEIGVVAQHPRPALAKIGVLVGVAAVEIGIGAARGALAMFQPRARLEHGCVATLGQPQAEVDVVVFDRQAHLVEAADLEEFARFDREAGARHRRHLARPGEHAEIAGIVGADARAAHGRRSRRGRARRRRAAGGRRETCSLAPTAPTRGAAAQSSIRPSQSGAKRPDVVVEEQQERIARGARAVVADRREIERPRPAQHARIRRPFELFQKGQRVGGFAAVVDDDDLEVGAGGVAREAVDADVEEVEAVARRHDDRRLPADVDGPRRRRGRRRRGLAAREQDAPRVAHPRRRRIEAARSPSARRASPAAPP